MPRAVDSQTRVADGCFLVRASDVTVLLDCPLDLPALSVFVPQFRTQTVPGVVRRPGSAPDDVLVELRGQERIAGAFQLCAPRFDLLDAAAIDVVLISNATSTLALPYLLRRPGFRARIFATEPTCELGRCGPHAARLWRARLRRSPRSGTAGPRRLGRPAQNAGKPWWSSCSCSQAGRPGLSGASGLRSTLQGGARLRWRPAWAIRTAGWLRTRWPRWTRPSGRSSRARTSKTWWVSVCGHACCRLGLADPGSPGGW